MTQAHPFPCAPNSANDIGQQSLVEIPAFPQWLPDHLRANKKQRIRKQEQERDTRFSCAAVAIERKRYIIGGYTVRREVMTTIRTTTRTLTMGTTHQIDLSTNRKDESPQSQSPNSAY